LGGRLSGVVMPNPNPLAAPDVTALDLRRYLRAVWKRRWFCASVILVTVASAVIFTSMQTPMFQASATVLIDPEPPKVVNRVQDLVQGAGSEEYHATQVRLIQARPVIEGAVQRLRAKQQFDGIGESGDAYWRVLGGLTVDPVKNTRLVNVRFMDADPRVAAVIANAVAQEFVRYNLEVKNKIAQEALVWLNEQLASLRTQTQQSSKALQAYQARADLMGLKEQQDLAHQKIKAAMSAYLDAQNQRLAIEIKLRELSRASQDSKGAEAIYSVAADPLIQKLKSEASDLQIERTRLGQIYKEKHPDLQTLDSQIKQINLRLQAEIQRLLRAVETELKVARIREETLAASVDQIRKEARHLTERETQALGLQWEKDSNEELQGAVLKRLKEMGVATMLEASSVRLVEPAFPPGLPSRPRKSLIWSLSVVAGLALSIGMALLAESLDNRVRSREDIERAGLTLLGIVPIFEVRRGASRP
jgi:polysaccharide biosynthesis transport protein